MPHSAVGRRSLDEYELTQHYFFWHQDLGLAAESGATMIRYGFPWYRINPEPGRFAWDWADEVVDRLDELGLEPIVDLVHYGTPLWLDNQFLNHSYPELVAEYAHQMAERYAGRLHVYTPLNEALVNATYCGESGKWPPYLVGHDGFVKLARAIAKGIVLTQTALAQTLDDPTFVHVEAAFRYVGAPDAMPGDIHIRNERRFLIEDLVTGAVDDDHALIEYLRAHGFDDGDLEWFRDNTAAPDVMGVNYYPHISTKEFIEPGVSRTRDDWTAGLEEVLREYAGRYGVPLFVTETSAEGTVQERMAWLDASVAAVHSLRARGVPVIGYTWWPLFHLVDWEYRHASTPLDTFIVPMGMYDLQPDGIGVLRRARTPVVGRFRALATASSGPRVE